MAGDSPWEEKLEEDLPHASSDPYAVTMSDGETDVRRRIRSKVSPPSSYRCIQSKKPRVNHDTRAMPNNRALVFQETMMEIGGR